MFIAWVKSLLRFQNVSIHLLIGNEVRPKLTYLACLIFDVFLENILIFLQVLGHVFIL